MFSTEQIITTLSFESLKIQFIFFPFNQSFINHYFMNKEVSRPLVNNSSKSFSSYKKKHLSSRVKEMNDKRKTKFLCYFFPLHKMSQFAIGIPIQASDFQTFLCPNIYCTYITPIILIKSFKYLFIASIHKFRAVCPPIVGKTASRRMFFNTSTIEDVTEKKINMIC